MQWKGDLHSHRASWNQHIKTVKNQGNHSRGISAESECSAQARQASCHWYRLRIEEQRVGIEIPRFREVSQARKVHAIQAGL